MTINSVQFSWALVT